MVEVNGAYKHSRHEKNWLNSLRVMSNVKAPATQDGWPASQPAIQTRLIAYLDPYDTQMDLNVLCAKRLTCWLDFLQLLAAVAFCGLVDRTLAFCTMGVMAAHSASTTSARLVSARLVSSKNTTPTEVLVVHMCLVTQTALSHRLPCLHTLPCLCW